MISTIIEVELHRVRNNWFRLKVVGKDGKGKKKEIKTNWSSDQTYHLNVGDKLNVTVGDTE